MTILNPTLFGLIDAKRLCKRSNGTFRAWFHTREEAEAFEADPRNLAYHGDIAHLCPKCSFWHLSRPDWLERPDLDGASKWKM